MDGDKLITSWVDTVNRGDVDAFGQMYAPDAVLYVPVAPEGVKGREEIARYEGALFAAFSDVSLETSPVLAGGDRLAVEWEYKAKHTGPLALPTQTIAPTNRSLSLQGASFLRINAQGEIAEERRYYNPSSLFEQLGLGQ